jgi:RNA polymerase sigma factor (sigma-70 family)
MRPGELRDARPRHVPTPLRQPPQATSSTCAIRPLLPDQAVVRVEEESMVRNAVDRIDERCRQLLELLFYRPDPPPYAEVAAQLGIAEGSIGPTRARCLERLRVQLANAGF